MKHLLLIIIIANLINQLHSICHQRKYKGAYTRIVCVCNSTHCDDIEPIGELTKDAAIAYESDLSGHRLRKYSLNISRHANDKDYDEIVTFDGSIKMQTMFGFGGAFTDSAGINLAALDEKLADKIIDAYFGENGIEYNIGRVPIASCDFSTRIYSYADQTDDFELNSFALSPEDHQYKIPFIKKAMRAANGKLKLFASPWSSPGWMKDTRKMEGGGSLINSTRVYKSYASYFTRFFDEYQKNGVEFWAVTVQNEPSTGADPTWRWQTLNFSSYEMRDFLKYYLGPELKSNDVTRKLKIIVLDDDIGLLPGYVNKIFNDPIATKYADGVGIHWYSNLYMPASLINQTHQLHPDKFILATEACTGFELNTGPIMGDWFRAELYASDIISDMNQHVVGWTDWNLCLDTRGGPNWARNWVDSPIIVNATAGEFYKQPMFYALAHFAKFVPRGSRRVLTSTAGNGIEATGVTRNDGLRVAVLHNRSFEPKRVKVLDVVSKRSMTVSMKGKSIQTLLWKK